MECHDKPIKSHSWYHLDRKFKSHLNILEPVNLAFLFIICIYCITDTVGHIVFQGTILNDVFLNH